MDLKKISKILIFFGIALIVIALVMDTSVSSGYGRVHNIGLVSQQQNLLLIGGMSFLAGIILIATNQKSRHIEDENVVEVSKEIIIPNWSKIEKRPTLESDKFYGFLNTWLTSERDRKPWRVAVFLYMLPFTISSVWRLVLLGLYLLRPIPAAKVVTHILYLHTALDLVFVIFVSGFMEQGFTIQKLMAVGFLGLTVINYFVIKRLNHNPR